MFCQNCWKVVKEGAKFCPYCGGAVEEENIVVDTQTKSGLEIGGIIKTVIALAAVAAVALVWFHIMPADKRINFVKSHTPFTDMDYTYGEVLDKYVSNAKWSARGIGASKGVRIKGDIKGTHSDIVLDIEVKPDKDKEDWFEIYPVYLRVDNEEYKDEDALYYNFLRVIFVCYDEGDTDVSELAEYLDYIMSL